MSEQSKSKAGPAEEVVAECPHCGKPLPLCICDSITPIESKISLLILQHPQEQDRALADRAIPVGVTYWLESYTTGRDSQSANYDTVSSSSEGHPLCRLRFERYFPRPG